LLQQNAMQGDRPPNYASMAICMTNTFFLGDLYISNIYGIKKPDQTRFFNGQLAATMAFARVAQICRLFLHGDSPVATYLKRV
jgi:hypothetical protein